jgi:hypothetical protein
MPERIHAPNEEHTVSCFLISGVRCWQTQNSAFFMKNTDHRKITARVVPVSVQKTCRDNVWCEKFGYFIDLDACRARSFQKKACRLCFSTRIQLSLPFD